MNTVDNISNLFCDILGADTPFYLATLPEGATEPNGQFIVDRKIVNVI